MMRSGQRKKGDMRKVRITRPYLKNAEGSCLYEIGDTKVICSASVEETVPPFLRGRGSGWITAEYGMLPRSCPGRVQRESIRGRPSGRTHEIQRLIGRAFRSVTDLGLLGERTIWIDCDVVQADGGTRCASISGGFIALMDAILKLKADGVIEEIPIRDYVAAASSGIIDGKVFLDLDYEEDSRAEVDMNVVMTGSGDFVEIQGTAEKRPFTEKRMREMLLLAGKGIRSLIKAQKKELGNPL